MPDYKQLLKQANDALTQANARKMMQNNEERKNMIAMLGADLIDSIKPAIKAMQFTKEDLKEALKNVKISAPIEQPDVIVNVPPIQVPEANVNVEIPDIKVPTPIVNYTPPTINIPRIEWPKESMPIEGWVKLQGVTLENPLPVQLRDASGRPVNLLENLTTLVSGGGGGGRGVVKVSGFDSSAYSNLQNGDGRLKVSVETGGSGLTDSELRATSLTVNQLSGANWSVTSTLDSTNATTMWNADNRLRVSVETGSSGLTDAELRAASIQVGQVSGAIWSAKVTGFDTSVIATILNGDGNSLDPRDRNWTITETVPVSATDLDVRDLDYTTDDVSIYQVSGHSWSTNATIQNATLAVTQSGTWDEVGINDSGNSITIDTTQSFEVKQVSGFSDSVFITGFADSSVVYEVMTTNKTAKSDGADIRPKADDLGRQITRPIQVRDLIVTAYASATTGTEGTLLAGSASTFHDLIYVMCANQSDAATYIDFRCGTAGAVVLTVEVPANGTAGVSLPLPIPMPEVAQAWTYDMPDITGTTVNISALFSKEV